MGKGQISLDSIGVVTGKVASKDFLATFMGNFGLLTAVVDFRALGQGIWRAGCVQTARADSSGIDESDQAFKQRVLHGTGKLPPKIVSATDKVAQQNRRG